MSDLDLQISQLFKTKKQAEDIPREPFALHHLSHDLRGPLNAIIGFSEILLDGIEGPLNEAQLEDINSIHESAHVLLRLISDAVDLSKLDEDQLNLNFEPIGIAPIIDQLLETKFEADIPLTAQIDQPDLAIPSENGRLDQMLFNIVEFAMKADQVERVTLTTIADETYLTLQVVAVGGQIPEHELEHLFDLTVKAGTRGQNKLGRGGIELPLTQKLTKLHQGEFWLEQQAEGLTLYLKLPLQQPA